MADDLKFFNSLYDPAKRHMQALSAEWDEYEKAYLGEPERTKPGGAEGGWRSFIHYKYAWQQVQTLVAELCADADPSFMWEPRNSAQANYAETVQGIIGQQFERDDYPEKRYMSVLTAAVYGGCPIKYSWLYECYGNGAEKVIVNDRPTATLLDPRQFFYDPRARHMREARYAGHVMRLEVAELKARKRADGTPFYKNLDQLDDAPNEGSNELDTNQLDNDHSGERDKARRKGVEVVELWTRDRVMVRANGIIIRDDPNPLPFGRLPFEVVRLIPTLNDVWGASLMWALRDPQSLIQSLDNAAMDQVKLALDPPLAVDSSDPRNVDRVLYPGQRFPSRSPKDAVIPVRVTQMDPFTAQQSIQGARDLMKHVSGITDSLEGNISSDTATEAAINQRQSKGRVGVMLTSVDAAWARVAGGFLQLNQRYLNLADPVKVMGPGKAEWRHIRPSEIAGMWDVRPKNASERVIKELHRQTLMEAIGSLAPLAERTTATGKTVDLTVFAEELAESFGFDKNRVVVDAAFQRMEHQKDVIEDAKAQSAAAAMMPQQEAPAEAPQVVEEATPGVTDQIRTQYKDLDPVAKQAYLDEIGLPSEGVAEQAKLETDERKAKIKSIGHSAGQKARRDTEKGK
jgi:hypothetical protein